MVLSSKLLVLVLAGGFCLAASRADDKANSAMKQEEDGRRLAEVPDLSEVLTYGQTRQEAIERVQVLSLRVLADRLDHGEPVLRMSGVFAVTP